MDTGSKIKALRKKRCLTLEQVGDYVGVSKTTVLKWETGAIQNMRRDKIAKLARILQTTPDFLISDSDPSDDDDLLNAYARFDNIFPIDTVRIPFLGEVSCGEPVYASEEHESYILAGTDIKADFCLRAHGDSMIGARILDGDIVFVRRCAMVDNGQIAVVIVDDETTLKRVYYYRDKNILILHPENPAYQDMIYTDAELDTVKILGRAIAFQSDVR